VHAIFVSKEMSVALGSVPAPAPSRWRTLDGRWYGVVSPYTDYVVYEEVPTSD
jgi:hypothetical protein